MAIIALSMLAACGPRDPRDIPYAEFSTSDSAAGMQVINSMTREELELLSIGVFSYSTDTMALKKRSINQLIERGREVQGAENTR